MKHPLTFKKQDNGNIQKNTEPANYVRFPLTPNGSKNYSHGISTNNHILHAGNNSIMNF